MTRASPDARAAVRHDLIMIGLLMETSHIHEVGPWPAIGVAKKPATEVHTLLVKPASHPGRLFHGAAFRPGAAGGMGGCRRRVAARTEPPLAARRAGGLSFRKYAG